MNYNDEETPKLNLKKEKRMANTNLMPVFGLVFLLFILVFLLIFFITYNPKDSTSTKVEVSLNVDDVKVTEKQKCTVSNDAENDAKNLKFTYKKSEEKYYYGNSKNLIDEDGKYNEPSEKDLKNGIDLVVENMTKNIYINIEYSTGESDADAIKYTYDQVKNGKLIIPFSAYEKNDISVYVYDANGDCDSLIKHYDIVLPRYNILFENKKCSTNEGKESNYCSEFTYSNFDESALDKLSESKKEDSKINIPSMIFVFILFAGIGAFLFIKLK